MAKTTKKKLSLQAQRNYIDTGASMCPACGSFRLTELEQWREDDCTFQAISQCDECNAFWNEVFELTNIHSFVFGDDE